MSMEDAGPQFRFTPRVLRRIRGYVRVGLTGRAIARNVGCSYDSLRQICSRHGISLRRDYREGESEPIISVPIMPNGRSGQIDIVEIPLGRRVSETYRREAMLRGVNMRALMSRVLELVATDHLINAVLDEQL